MGRYIKAKKDPIWIGDGLLAQIAKKPKVAKVLTKKDLIEHIRRVLTWNGSKGWSVNPVDLLGSNPSSELIVLDYESRKLLLQ